MKKMSNLKNDKKYRIYKTIDRTYKKTAMI